MELTSPPSSPRKMRLLFIKPQTLTWRLTFIIVTEFVASWFRNFTSIFVFHCYCMNKQIICVPHTLNFNETFHVNETLWRDGGTMGDDRYDKGHHSGFKAPRLTDISTRQTSYHHFLVRSFQKSHHGHKLSDYGVPHLHRKQTQPAPKNPEHMKYLHGYLTEDPSDLWAFRSASVTTGDTHTALYIHNTHPALQPVA